MTCFVLINQSTVTDAQFGGELTPAVLQQIADALTAQDVEDVTPIWGVPPGGTVTWRVGSADGKDLTADECPAYIVDAFTDIPGAAAYHSTTANGRPIIYAAREAFDSLTKGPAALSVGLSHESIETRVDPGANRLAQRADGKAKWLEACDQVEDTTYEKLGVAVSNFLTPNAFDVGAPGPYDYLSVLTDGDARTPGGYDVVEDLGGESQETGMHTAEHARPGIHLEGMPRNVAKKAHHSSRSYRRGLRLVPPAAPTPPALPLQDEDAA